MFFYKLNPHLSYPSSQGTFAAKHLSVKSLMSLVPSDLQSDRPTVSKCLNYSKMYMLIFHTPKLRINRFYRQATYRTENSK